VHCWNPDLECTCVVETRALNENRLWLLKQNAWTRETAVFGKKKWTRNPEAAVMGFDPVTRAMFLVVGVDWSAKVPCWAILVAQGLSRWKQVAVLHHNSTDRSIGLGVAVVQLAWNPASRELVAVGSPHDDGYRWAVMRISLGRFLDTLSGSAGKLNQARTPST